jgi:hypothetical protein
MPGSVALDGGVCVDIVYALHEVSFIYFALVLFRTFPTRQPDSAFKKLRTISLGFAPS